MVQLDASLVCDGVSKAFGHVKAVQDISFTVAPGETLGIAGSNGAGKSTLFNLVAGHLRPDSGSISFGGERIDGKRPDLICKLGIVRTFQTTAISPQQTVMENAVTAAAFGGRHRIQFTRYPSEILDRALDALELVGLDGEEAKLAGQLSVFDQRRLMLASALAADPALLMLDEPVGGLLPDEIDHTVGIVAAARDSGVSLIVIEHVMSFLTRVCPERILIMHQGARLFEGSAAEVQASPAVRDAWLGEDLRDSSGLVQQVTR